MTMPLDTIVCMDALKLCHAAADAGIQADMILADLPYGTTACAWDAVIPFAPMWEAFKRVIKPRGAIVLTASQPFASALVMSNPKWFRYEWIWAKTGGGGFLNANRRPLPRHENALVFYQSEGIYNPQMTQGKPYTNKRGAAAVQVNNGGKANIEGYVTVSEGERYPKSVLYVPNETGLHPTQKPVALFRYLIRTYTQPGELVFDCCVGSGTTAIAARQECRHWLCGDSSAEYVEIARRRLSEPYTPDMFAALETAVQP